MDDVERFWTNACGLVSGPFQHRFSEFRHDWVMHPDRQEVSSGRSAALALHIGADVLTSPEHAQWPAVRSCRDTVRRMSRLAAAAGARDQRILLGAAATQAQVRSAIAQVVAELADDGLLVLTFTGHSERGEPDDSGARDPKWCLSDGTLRMQTVAELLAAAPAGALVVLISDTCWATALARFVRSAGPLVLIGACDEGQITLLRPISEFAVRLERAVLRPEGDRNPDCVSYHWLRAELQADTPDAERPQVWTNRPDALAYRPFEVTPAELPTVEFAARE